MDTAITLITQEIDRVETALQWLAEHNTSRTLINRAIIESETLYNIRSQLQAAQHNHADNNAINNLFARTINGFAR